MPPTISPNSITLIGTIFHIVGNLAMIVQESGKLSWPPSIFIFGLFIFIYYTLDNVDGKQARKTGSSSPLGMCMDHGCDALGVSFLCVGLCKTVLYTNNAALILTSQIAVLGTFWFSAFYQYHNNGVLMLGISRVM
jgi:ethanolaminephosphotransferase